MKQNLFVVMSDGSVWKVPTKVIAENRVTYCIRHLNLYRAARFAALKTLLTGD